MVFSLCSPLFFFKLLSLFFTSLFLSFIVCFFLPPTPALSHLLWRSPLWRLSWFYRQDLIWMSHLICKYLYLGTYLIWMKISIYTCLWNTHCKLTEGNDRGHCWRILKVCHVNSWVSSGLPSPLSSSFLPSTYIVSFFCFPFLFLYPCFLFPIGSVTLVLFSFWLHYYGQAKRSSVLLWSPLSLSFSLLSTSS